MLRSLAAAALLLTLFAPSAFAQDTVQARPPQANAVDVTSVDAILRALYDVISGPAGEPRNWDRFRSLFAPGARLIPVVVPQGGGPAQVRALTADEYVATAKRFFEQTGFYEHEIARRSEEFGHMVHAFSTYESRNAPADAQPFARGINSIQLMNDGTRWWVVTIFWDSERPGQPLPPKYLPQP